MNTGIKRGDEDIRNQTIALASSTKSTKNSYLIIRKESTKNNQLKLSGIVNYEKSQEKAPQIPPPHTETPVG